MAIFLPKPWVNPFGKISIFRSFEVFVFIAQKVVFSLQNIVKVIFLACIALKKKVGKMAFFRPKQWVNTFGKISIFRFFELFVFIAQKVVFSLQNIVKVIFLACIALKKKVGKMAFFRPKQWVNPFGKISIFRFFELLVFIAQKVFFSLEYRRRHFPCLYCLKKKVGKMASFRPKPWVNPC